MTNTIRTPREGVTQTSRRIAQAVDDESWQVFRVSLKGISTVLKLERLFTYWFDNKCTSEIRSDCYVCHRVDNYLKALARGGQIRTATGDYMGDFFAGALIVLK